MVIIKNIDQVDGTVIVMAIIIMKKKYIVTTIMIKTTINDDDNRYKYCNNKMSLPSSPVRL